MRKIIKSSNREQANTFRLHYFPNIPVPDATNGQAPGTTDTAGRGNIPANIAGDQRVGVNPPGNEDRHLTQEVERQAYHQGFTQGQQEGRAAIEQEAVPLFTALEKMLTEMDGLRSRIRQHIEQEVVGLALHIARKVVRHELSVSDDAILCVVKEAMDKLDDPGKISIRLNPDDMKRIHQAGERLQSLMDNLDSIQFEEDAGIDCGGCYIQTEYGEIDARVEEQLNAVEEAFRAEMRNPSA